jgi:uncharacterized protein
MQFIRSCPNDPFHTFSNYLRRMHAPAPHIINGHHFWPTPEKALYWEETATLIISDLHLGKTGHFRKEGIAVPQNIYKNDLQRLFALVGFYKAVRLLIVGDLFHSRPNKEHELFARWRQDHPQLEILLIKGNHDILPEEWYTQNQIATIAHTHSENGFSFTHEPPEETELYTFSGHIHPGVLLRGAGKQSLRLPCYWFQKKTCILPAFGNFTGFILIDPRPGDRVYAVAGKDVIPIKH